MEATAARKSEMFKSFSGRPAEVLSAQYEQYSKEQVLEASAAVLQKKPSVTQRQFETSEQFFRGGEGALSAGFSTGKNTYIAGATFKSRDNELVSFKSLDACYSNVSHVFFFARQAQAMLNQFFSSALGTITPEPSKITFSKLFEGQRAVIAGMVELFGGDFASLTNPAHVTLAYSRDKIVNFMSKEAGIKVTEGTARGAANRLGSLVRQMFHLNLPSYFVDGLSLNLTPNGDAGVSDYTLYHMDMPEANIVRFPLNATSPEAWLDWATNIRTAVSNKSGTLSKVTREPLRLTQDQLLELVGDFGFMHELDETMAHRFGATTAKVFFAPEKPRMKDGKPDFVGIKPGFVNTALMAAFKEANDDCVRYDVQYITPAEHVVENYLQMSLNTKPDRNLVKLVVNANRTYLVYPRVVISQEYIRYVAQSLPARDASGKITEPNMESLRSYFASVICGGFTVGGYTAPKEPYSLQASQLPAVIERRNEAGVPERPPATNEHNITVTAQAKAMYIPPKTASPGVLSMVDTLLHRRAKIASKLCVPPESSVINVERYVNSLPEHETPVGAGLSIPAQSNAKELFRQFKVVQTALASMQHLPLFTSQSIGFTLAFEGGRLATQTLEANKGLSEAAIQVTHNLHRSRDRIDSLFGESSGTHGNKTNSDIARLYSVLSLYGDVPKIEELFKPAEAEWKRNSGFEINELTCIDVYAGWYKGGKFKFDNGAANSTSGIYCIDPKTIPNPSMRDVATAMYKDANALREADANAKAIEIILNNAAIYEKGFLSADSVNIGHSEIAIRFIRTLAACLRIGGKPYDSMQDTDANFFAHAFLPKENVQVASEYASKLTNARVKTAAPKLAIPPTTSSDEDVDADDIASETSAVALPVAAYVDSDNPFSFFGNFRVVSSADTFVSNLKVLTRLSLVGIVANMVSAAVFEAINNPDSSYYKPFFPLGATENQVYTEDGGWESQVADYVPLVSVTNLTRNVMPLVYSRLIYAAKPELIAESLRKQLTSAGLSQDLLVRRGGVTSAVPLQNLMEKIDIPNLQDDTEIMRHQGVTLFNTVGSPQAKSGRLPNITVLAVDPGGGKTIMGESLALMITAIMQKHGKKTKFLVLAPNKIVKNWYDDAQRFFGHRLNVYPLDTDVFAMMPADYIRSMVLDAPDNSIFISSYSAMTKSAVLRVSVGSNQIQERSTLSFLLSLGFTDVLFDESHFGKNEHSITARSMASLCQAADVRAYLATGSMSAKSVADAASQLAMVDRGVMQSTATFYGMNVPDDEYEISPDGAVKDDKLSADSVRKLRNEMSRVCNFQYVPGSNWAFSRPKIVYDVAVIKPGYMCHSPDEEYYKAMQWMISNGYLSETWEEIVQRDVIYMNVYDLLLKAALSNTEAGQNLLSLGSVETEDAPKDAEDDDDDEDEYTEEVAEELSPQMLQRFSQYLNDPTHDVLDGKLVNTAKDSTGAPGADLANMAKINLSSVRAPKIRMAAYFAVKHFTDENGKVNVTADNIRGRKLVFVADNIRTLFAFRRQLPAFLRERTRISISGKPQSQTGFHPNYEKELEAFDFKSSQDARFDFESSDSVWILCAVESALSEGFNLQIANMMIRADSPWASKAWKQTKARIDRPDTGKFFRDVAYITWLVTDHTTELLRWARAVSRITTASVFDNANDSRFEQFKTVPLFSINVDTLREYSSYASLASVTVSKGGKADYIELFQRLQAVEQEVRADSMKNDWEYARKYNLIETLKDKAGNPVLRDGNPVQRPRLMARSQTSVLPGSREVLITPTVRGASNDRLRAYGFKTYSLSRLMSAYNVDLSTIKRADEEFGAHVYTAYGFGRVEGFGTSKGGGTPTMVSIRYPNGSSKSVPVNHVTVIEGVTQDNPNLWMLNCMLDIPTYFSRQNGEQAQHRIINFDNSTGKMVVREVASNKDGHAVLGTELKPADDFLEEKVTTFGNLHPRLDDGTTRSDSGIRASRLLDRDDVVLRQGKMYVIKPALSLSGRARKVELAVSVCEINEAGKRRKEVFVPYADFARDFGFRIAWPEDYSSMLRAAAIRNFDTNTTANSLKPTDFMLVEFVNGAPKAKTNADGTVAYATLSKTDIMRLAAGLQVPGFPQGTTLLIKEVGGNYELRYRFPGYPNLVKTGAPAVTETAARLISRCAAISFGEHTSSMGDTYNGFIYPDAKEPPLGSPQASKRIGTYAEVVTGKATKAGAEAEEAQKPVSSSNGNVTLLEFLMEDGVFAIPVLSGELTPVSGDGSSYTMMSLPALKLHYANNVRGKKVEVKPNTVVGQNYAAENKDGEYYDLSQAFKYMQYVLLPVPNIYADTVAIAKGLASEFPELVPTQAQDPAVYEFLTRPAAYLKNHMPDVKANHISTKAKFEKGTTNDARKLVTMLSSSAKKMTVIPVISRVKGGERQVYLFVQNPRAQAAAVKLARNQGATAHYSIKALTHPVPTFGNVTKWPSILGRVFGTDGVGDSLETFTRDLAEVAHGNLKTSVEKKR